jgi:CMP-2-keto-3-deoxyoctulosonic acid synthetase
MKVPARNPTMPQNPVAITPARTTSSRYPFASIAGFAGSSVLRNTQMNMPAATNMMISACT